jgi:hypothetical protein
MNEGIYVTFIFLKLALVGREISLVLSMIFISNIM